MGAHGLATRGVHTGSGLCRQQAPSAGVCTGSEACQRAAAHMFLWTPARQHKLWPHVATENAVTDAVRCICTFHASALKPAPLAAGVPPHRTASKQWCTAATPRAALKVTTP